MKKVGIVYHPLNEGTLSLAQKLASQLKSAAVESWLCSAWEDKQLCQQIDGTDLVLTIGGDGTILRTAQAVVTHAIPITGINMGNLGFLTELTAGEVADKLPILLAGKGWLDQRAMLEAELIIAGRKQQFFVLNDAVVARGDIARIIYVEAVIDGQPLTTYKADGVIAATATGSTGYALAAGGPILHPQTEQFLLVPIMPHLSFDNSLVLPPQAEVELRVGAIHKAIFSIDGHISLPLDGGDSIKIKHSRAVTRFLRISPQYAYYTTLEQKLKG